MLQQGDVTVPQQGNLTSDSGDYTRHPTYVRRALNSLNPCYDTRTLSERLDEAMQRIAHLEAIVHKYVNQDEADR